MFKGDLIWWMFKHIVLNIVGSSTKYLKIFNWAFIMNFSTQI